MCFPGAKTDSGLMMTQAGNLQCKKIIHISAQSNAVMIQKHVRKALEMCAKEKLTSIAFPAIGTGKNTRFSCTVEIKMKEQSLNVGIKRAGFKNILTYSETILKN